jgi:hypothetical protein
MASRKSSQSGADIDWYLISIDRLKQIMLLAVVAGIAVAAWFYYQSQQTPRQRAQRSIDAAEASLNELAASPELTNYRAEFERAKVKVDEALVLFGKEQYPQAESAAIESQAITRTALAGVGERDSDAQFLTVEGTVDFQKGGSGDWKKADRNTPLFNGDWVRTAGSSSAELFFSNGSIYTIGPNALLEIYAVFDPAKNRKDNTVQMQVGRLEVNTSDDVSTVRTPGTQVVIQSESTAQVDVDDRSNRTDVVSIKGGVSVEPATGGPTVRLASGEQVSATKEGDLSEKSLYVSPPALQSPGENQVFQATGDMDIDFNWAPQRQAAAYQLQVSRSRLFSALEIDAKRDDTRARVRVTSEGFFYWRVASIDADGKVGVYSPFRRFRVAGVGSSPTPTVGMNKKPPDLSIKRPTSLGGQFYLIEGQAEPGATVFVNDEEVGTDPDGSFRKLISFNRVGINTVVVKAVDPAGNQSVQRQNVYVEE